MKKEERNVSILGIFGIILTVAGCVLSVKGIGIGNPIFGTGNVSKWVNNRILYKRNEY
jgi:hypothetical protein